MKPPRIVVVEDEPAIRRGVADALRACGYDVAEAADGVKGLAEASRADADLVLLDLMLPRMDGMEVLRELRLVRPAVPVIILTAHGTIPDAVSATQRGVFGFLTKPFDSQELLQKVASAVRLTGDEPEANKQTSGEWRAGIITRSPSAGSLGSA